MKTFYPGCKVDTNIPVSELFFAIKIYDEASKKYIFDMKPVLLNPNKEASTVFISRTDIPVNAARKHRVTVYLYRSWSSSKLKLLVYRDVGSLASFEKPDSFRQLSPLKAKQSKDNSQESIPKEESPTVVLRIPRRNIFVTPEYPSEHPNDPFRKNRIEEDLNDRLQGKSYPDQKSSSLCGPAAYFYCLLKDRPDLYRRVVTDLWEEGETNFVDMSLKPNSSTKPKNFFHENGDVKLNGIDWISMASLRNSFNTLLPYNSPDDDLAAITGWSVIEEWFVKTGAKILANRISITGDNIESLAILNEWKKRFPDCHIINLVTAGKLLKHGSQVLIPIKNHWIVWDGMLLTTSGRPINRSSDKNLEVQLKLFTWGRCDNKQLKLNLTLEQFCNASFGALVISKIP